MGEYIMVCQGLCYNHIRITLLCDLRVFFLTIPTTVDLFFLICQKEDMGQTLLNGGDATGIATFDHISDLLWQYQLLLFHNVTVLDHIDSDAVVDKTQNIQIQGVDITFYLEDIFFAHFIAAGVFDDRHGTVQLVQLQMIVNVKTSSGFDMVKDKAFFNSTYI